MNEDIFAKARELGELIKRSDAFTAMRLAEEKANNNKELTALSGEYEQARYEMQEKTMEENPNYEQIGAISKRMDALQAKMMEQGDMVVLHSAREQFTALMSQVNRELQGVLMPESLNECGGCSGSCGSCHGCH